MAERLTEALIKRLVWQADQSDIVFDAEVPGFGVRLYKSGSKSFLFDYRLRGRQHRHVLGKVGAWSLEAARQHARTLRVDVDKGIDPFGKQGSAAPQWTVSDAWKRYERDYLPKMAPRAAADTRAIWRDYILPKVGQKRVGIWSSPTASVVHRSDRRALSCKPNIRDFAPRPEPRREVGMDRPQSRIGLEVNDETPRNDYLTAAEVRAILAALPHTESGDAIRMLLLTGARARRGAGDALGASRPRRGRMDEAGREREAAARASDAAGACRRRGNPRPAAPWRSGVLPGRWRPYPRHP